jgi:DNA-binding winged helix-turn-helix (wHTH) protein
MKEVLQHVKEVLERTFDQPNSSELDQCITELQQALETSGDKGKMIEDVIRH